MSFSVSHRIAVYTFGVIFSAMFLFCAGIFAIQIYQWHALKPDVSITSKAWNFSYNYGEATPPSMLWLKGNPRQPQSQRKPFEQTEESFWIGTEISTQLLAEAKKLEADRLNLGWVNGGYELWLNNTEVLASDIPGDQIVIDVKSYLEKKAPLKIALKVKNPEKRPRPDNLSYYYGKELGEGFYTPSALFQFDKLLSFSRNIRPAILALANIMISLFFFFLWSAAPLKRELFYMAVYTFVGAAFQIFLINSVSAQLSYAPASFINTSLVYLEGVTALMLAASFARRHSLNTYFWALVALGPITAAYCYNNFSAQYFVGRVFHNWADPIFYTAGAYLCIKEWAKIRDKMPSRANRLLRFSCALFFIAAINVLDGIFWNKVPFLENVLLLNFFNFGLVLFLAAIEIKEYRQERKILQKTPISIYHRKASLPSRINGVMLTVDLKNSEFLFRLESTEEGIVGSCLSILWGAVLEFGGVTISTEGDSLCAFFDSDFVDNPLNKASMTLLKMQRELSLFETQLKQRSDEIDIKIQFRACIVSGAIRPIWQSTGDTQQASWSEASGEHCFLESARLLELEKEYLETKQKTTIVVASSIADKISSIHLELYAANEKRAGKHGREYRFSVFTIRRQEAQQAIKLAA